MAVGGEVSYDEKLSSLCGIQLVVGVRDRSFELNDKLHDSAVHYRPLLLRCAFAGDQDTVVAERSERLESIDVHL